MTAGCDPRVLRIADVIEQQGFPVTVRRPSTGSYSSSTRSLSQGAPQHETETRGVIETFRTSEFGGTSVEVGDLLLTVPASALEFAPAPGDEVDYDGATWRVLVSKPQPVAGTIAAHQLQIRK